MIPDFLWKDLSEEFNSQSVLSNWSAWRGTSITIVMSMDTSGNMFAWMATHQTTSIRILEPSGHIYTTSRVFSHRRASARLFFTWQQCLAARMRIAQRCAPDEAQTTWQLLVLVARCGATRTVRTARLYISCLLCIIYPWRRATYNRGNTNESSIN